VVHRVAQRVPHPLPAEVAFHCGLLSVLGCPPLSARARFRHLPPSQAALFSPAVLSGSLRSFLATFGPQACSTSSHASSSMRRRIRVEDSALTLRASTLHLPGSRSSGRRGSSSPTRLPTRMLACCFSSPHLCHPSSPPAASAPTSSHGFSPISSNAWAAASVSMV